MFGSVGFRHLNSVCQQSGGVVLTFGVIPGGDVSEAAWYRFPVFDAR
jgi:hypothetical protein